MITIIDRLKEIRESIFIDDKKESLNKVLNGYSKLIEGRELINYEIDKLSGLPNYELLSYCQIQYCLRHFAKTGHLPRKGKLIPNDISLEVLL